MFLKKRFGAGYHLTLVRGSQGGDPELLTKVVTEYVPTAKLESSVNLESTFSLPNDECDKFEAMLARIETDKSLDIVNYGISVTTMEEVFLKVGEYATEKINALKSEENGHQQEAAAAAAQTVPKDYHQPTSIIKNQGLKLLWQQFYGLSVKKVLSSYRSPMMLAVQFLLPAILINFGILVERSVPRQKESPPLHMSIDQFKNPMVMYFQNEPNSQLAKDYGAMLARVVDRHRVTSVTGIDPNIVLAKVTGVPMQEYSYEYMISAKIDEQATRINATAMFNNQAYHTPAIALSCLDQALLSYGFGLGNVSLQVTNHPMPITFQESTQLDVTQVQAQFQIIQSLVIAMAFLIGTFAVQIVRERVTKAKHLQMLSGARLGLYWLSHFVFDVLIYLVSCLLIVISLIAWSEKGLSEGGQPWYLLFTFFVHGLAIIPCVYCASFIFALPATAYARLCLILVIGGMATILTDQITNLKQLDLATANDIVNPIFGAFVPVFNLGKIVTNLIANHENSRVCLGSFEIHNHTVKIQELCKQLETNSLIEPVRPCCKKLCGENCLAFEEDIFTTRVPGVGMSLVYLVICAFIYWMLLALIEFNVIRWARNQIDNGKKSFMASLTSTSTANNNNNSLLAIDDDVLEEKKTIQQITPRRDDDYSMVVRNLRKEFSNFVAVDNISYSVRRGECFGLLGVNGAGKTTSFKMITGDEPMTAGDVFINGMSVRTDIRRIQQEIGYCPQFDATFDDLSGAETLTFYSRLRGIQEAQIIDQIKELSQLLYFDMHVHKLVGAYSGGNKRKLSAAIVSFSGDGTLSLILMIITTR